MVKLNVFSCETNFYCLLNNARQQEFNLLNKPFNNQKIVIKLLSASIVHDNIATLWITFQYAINSIEC